MAKSWTVFLLTLFAALLLVRFYPDRGIAFTLLYALALLFLLSLGTVLAALGALRLDESLEQDVVFKNESLDYAVTLKNCGPFFYPRVRLTYYNADLIGYSDEAQDAPLLPLGRISGARRVRFPYRGVYAVGIESVTVTDFLGLFRIPVAFRRARTVTVYPESDEGFTWSVRNEPQNSALNSDRFDEDYASVADVRKYMDSDSLRKIHWKLSAKRGELLVKNYHMLEPNRKLLLLDTRELPLTGLRRAGFEDKMVSYAAAAINYCLGAKLPADFVFGAGEADRLDLSDTEELGEVFRLLAGVRFEAAQSTVYAVGDIAGTYDAVVFLADMDAALHDALRDLISFDHNLILYYFYPRTEPPDEETSYLLESLAAYGAGVNKVEVADDAQ